LIDLTLAPELTIDLGEAPVMSLPNDGEGKAVMHMPRFYSMKTQTQVTISDGGSALIATLIPQKEDGTQDASLRVLIFVTARLVKP
jgi:Flp pilus assembly secretin CpaC